MSFYGDDMKKIAEKNERARKFNREISHDSRADIFYESEEEKARKRIATEERYQKLNDAYFRGEEVNPSHLWYPEMVKEPGVVAAQKERFYAKAWADTHGGKIDGFKEFAEEKESNGGDLYLAWKKVNNGSEVGFAEYLRALDD